MSRKYRGQKWRLKLLEIWKGVLDTAQVPETPTSLQYHLANEMLSVRKHLVLIRYM